VTVERNVGWLTFNHPEKHNSLTYDMILALPGAVATLDADPDVAVIGLRGAGDKAFVSGVNLDQQNSTIKDVFIERAQRSIWTLEDVEKPVVALIRGDCIGSGLEIALRADIRIAHEDGVFAFPAARIGNSMPFDDVCTLIGLIGPARTAELLYTARRYPASAALEMGLVQYVLPEAELVAWVETFAAEVARSAPLTIRSVKASLREAQKPPERRDLTDVTRLFEACLVSDDLAEGHRAFFEKREPRFRGR
jgi:enoyl-CoA hydratase